MISANQQRTLRVFRVCAEQFEQTKPHAQARKPQQECQKRWLAPKSMLRDELCYSTRMPWYSKTIKNITVYKAKPPLNRNHASLTTPFVSFRNPYLPNLMVHEFTLTCHQYPPPPYPSPHPHSCKLPLFPFNLSSVCFHHFNSPVAST